MGAGPIGCLHVRVARALAHGGQATMKFIELFAGIGGFRLGLEQAGHQCVWANEILEKPRRIYARNFGHEPDPRDVRTIQPSDIPDADLLCGGFPCATFSVAGKRSGFSTEDTRGTLFFEICRILRDKRIPYVFLENVKGLLSHDNGRTFKTIITSLAEFGYAVEWQVLNAKDFGVPQNRERVFIVGHLGGFRGRKIFPISGSNEQNDEKRTLAYTLNSSDWRWANRNQKQTTIRTDQQDSQERGNQPNNSNSIRRTSYSNGMRIRRLTPTECERLMGLPDGWTEGVSDTQRYKLAGNGVVVNVVEEIVKRLIKNYQ